MAEWIPFGVEFVKSIAPLLPIPVYTATMTLAGSKLFRRMRKLYPQIQTSHRVPFVNRVNFGLTGDVYNRRIPLVAVLYGPNKSGKTTALMDAIPWYRRMGPYPVSGLYLDGSTADSTFNDWLATSLECDNRERARTELFSALRQRMSRQVIRNVVGEQILGCSHTDPRWYVRVLSRQRPLVMLDNFEYIMRKCPEESLKFLDELGDMCARNNSIRVIVVVNTPGAVNAIKALNKGQRFDIVPFILVTEKEAKDAGFDEKQMKKLEACMWNIGAFHEAPSEDPAKWYQEFISHWDSTCHWPPPPKFVWVRLGATNEEAKNSPAMKVFPTVLDVDGLKKAVLEERSKAGVTVDPLKMQVFAKLGSVEVTKQSTALGPNDEVTAYHIIIPK